MLPGKPAVVEKEAARAHHGLLGLLGAGIQEKEAPEIEGGWGESQRAVEAPQTEAVREFALVEKMTEAAVAADVPVAPAMEEGAQAPWELGTAILIDVLMKRCWDLSHSQSR